ncbi:Oligosaccharyl transferase STT3 subunit, partial [Rhizoctonia solani]
RIDPPGVFGLLQLIAFTELVRSHLPSKQFQLVLRASVGVLFVLGTLGLVVLTSKGWIAPWTGRFYSLWDTGYAKIHIPIIASVSEHQPTAWPAFFMDLNFLIFVFPVGVVLCFKELRDEHVFVIIYAVVASYFAGDGAVDVDAYAVREEPDAPEEPVLPRPPRRPKPMVLRFSSCLCLCCYPAATPKKQQSKKKSSGKKTGIYGLDTRLAVIGNTVFLMLVFVLHCTWVTSNAYSSPRSSWPRAAGRVAKHHRRFPRGVLLVEDEHPETSVVASWWDYGYQIAGMADRPTLVDNNTWNNTHIATVGKIMASPEDKAYPILRKHDVDYARHFRRVARIFRRRYQQVPLDGSYRARYLARRDQGGELFHPAWRVQGDESASAVMKESVMYKTSYYRFSELFGGGQAVDRVRQQHLPKQGPTLDYLEEAFTSENWIVRIYKVKQDDPLGRDHKVANAFAAGKKRKRTRTRAVCLHNKGVRHPPARPTYEPCDEHKQWPKEAQGERAMGAITQIQQSLLVRLILILTAMSVGLMNMGGYAFSSPNQSNPAWYKDSLTNALRALAQKSKSTLPRDVHVTIEEAAGRTYIHEYYIRDLHAANPDQPVHPDSSFVYTGYKASLAILLSMVSQPGLDGTPGGKICRGINACLQDILALVRSKGNDVGRLFKDPEMNRLLANLANI